MTQFSMMLLFLICIQPLDRFCSVVVQFYLKNIQNFLGYSDQKATSLILLNLINTSFFFFKFTSDGTIFHIWSISY